MAAGLMQRYSGMTLPETHESARGGLEKVVSAHGSNVVGTFVFFAFCRRQKYELITIDGIVPLHIDFGDGIQETLGLPRSFHDLVSIVVNEPVGNNLICQSLLLPALRDEIEVPLIRQSFDAANAPVAKRLRYVPRAINGVVVDDAGLQPLSAKVLQASLQVERFVTDGQQGNNSHIVSNAVTLVRRAR
jgi:hypothetical protein